jgi:uncharacterized protein YjaZ
MSKLNLHIINANGALDKFLPQIKRAVEHADRYAVPRLNIDKEIDVIFRIPGMSGFYIPEENIGGRAENNQLVQIVINNDAKKLDESLIFQTLCHELCHVIRYRKFPKYDLRLSAGIISEGLATVFEEISLIENKLKNTGYFLLEVQNTTNFNVIYDKIKSDFDSKHWDSRKYFFEGDKKLKLPRWSGYKVGYYLIKKYLESSGADIVDAIGTPVDDFIKIVKE